MPTAPKPFRLSGIRKETGTVLDSPAPIYAVLDVSNVVAGESSTVPVSFRIPDSLKGFGAVGTYSVSVNIAAVEEES